MKVQLTILIYSTNICGMHCPLQFFAMSDRPFQCLQLGTLQTDFNCIKDQKLSTKFFYLKQLCGVVRLPPLTHLMYLCVFCGAFESNMGQLEPSLGWNSKGVYFLVYMNCCPQRFSSEGFHEHQTDNLILFFSSTKNPF